jgi:hypothetical protein
MWLQTVEAIGIISGYVLSSDRLETQATEIQLKEM